MTIKPTNTKKIMSKPEEKTVSLFVKNINKSNGEIISARSERYGKAAERSQRAILDTIEKQMDVLQDELENLEDLSPDTQLSLQPIKGGEFNANAWTKRMQELQIQIANLEFEKEIAQKTYNKYFKVTE